MFYNKSMIKSGLVNRRLGGGFEEGFPHERDGRNSVLIRPYVDSNDTGYAEPSDFSIIIPKPVSYAQIFAKELTPSERAYMAKQLKRGFKRQRIKRKVYEKDDTVLEPDAPDTPEIEPGQEPEPKKELALELEGDDNWEKEWELRNELNNEMSNGAEKESYNIVYPTPHEETYAEEERAEKMWEDRVIDTEMTDVVENRHTHTSNDDIVMDSVHEFGGGTIPKVVSKVKTVSKSQITNTIQSNGVGPLRRERRKKDKKEIKMDVDEDEEL